MEEGNKTKLNLNSMRDLVELLLLLLVLFHFAVSCDEVVDSTVRGRMFVAPKRGSIRFCAGVCADVCSTCSETVMGCVSRLELPGYVQVGFSRSVCSK